MVDLAVITGSGFYDFEDIHVEEIKDFSTKYGDVSITIGKLEGKSIAFLSRHEREHRILPNKINYRANLLAVKATGAGALISTTVCGVLNPDIPLARTAVFDDMFFPDNRLPNGDICTIYDEIEDRKKGHFIFDNPFSEDLRQQLVNAAENPVIRAVYAHAAGPRFNTKAEIKMLRSYASFVSQTAGPEIVLAGELEIPCALIGFGVDYANGVTEVPTPVEVLSENLQKSKSVFLSILINLLKDFHPVEYDKFIYRFV